MEAIEIRVSGIPAPFEPTVRTVAITSDPGGDATYGRDDRIQVSVTFDQTVTVDTSGGTPSLTIDFHTAASGEQTANYVRGSGTSTLVFEFTVVQANTSTPGVAVKANSLAANGATIKAADGLDALLGHKGLGHDTAHKVDGSAARRPVVRLRGGVRQPGVPRIHPRPRHHVQAGVGGVHGDGGRDGQRHQQCGALGPAGDPLDGGADPGRDGDGELRPSRR